MTQSWEVFYFFPDAHPQHFTMPQSYPQVRNGYMTSVTPRPSSAAGKRGGRRPKECEEFDIALSEEEKDKRDKRRLRNKEAAARCRQRRLDLMGSLQAQVDSLKAENKDKDLKINQLQILVSITLASFAPLVFPFLKKAELLEVIRKHRCVLPDSLRQSLDAELSNTCVPCSTAYEEVTTDLPFLPPTTITPSTLICSRKRPVSEIVSDFRSNNEQLASTTLPLNSGSVDVTAKGNVVIKQESSIKSDPTLFDVNGRDHPDEELKRPTSLDESLSIANANFNNNNTSGITITTPSTLTGEYPANSISLMDGRTGLTPMPNSLTQFTGAITPLSSEGHSYANL
uniref:BZIP domain-containing protein n=1 Tax=Syphacia muris TaxID=451379 RepID=A0A0N5AUP3_9BILA